MNIFLLAHAGMFSSTHTGRGKIVSNAHLHSKTIQKT